MIKNKIHKCEPSLDVLYRIYSGLNLNNTDGVKKANAIRVQIERVSAAIENETT